jgi:hypothetical protein
MRRMLFSLGMTAVVLGVGCRSTTGVDPRKLAVIDVYPPGGSSVAPPGPGDISRTFAADRAKVAKVVFKQLSPGVTTDGDFAIDQARGPLFFQKSTSVESRVRSLRGIGPGGGRLLVEIRPEATGCTVIVRGGPAVEEAAALVLLDKIEADLKPPAPASKS